MKFTPGISVDICPPFVEVQNLCICCHMPQISKGDGGYLDRGKTGCFNIALVLLSRCCLSAKFSHLV